MDTATGTWTVAERDRLPNDGNRYEVVDGELFVTPMPVPRHQLIVQRLWRLLDPYVRLHGIGSAFCAGTDVYFDSRNAVVPDVAVYDFPEAQLPRTWQEAPKPILVAEVASDSTWRRDVGPKRQLYEKREVPEYWIVDGDDCTVTVVRPHEEDVVVRNTLRWQPQSAFPALEIVLADVFA
jgi:Uma2 family endonuclease